MTTQGETQDAKAEAWKTLNSVLIKSNADFMAKLASMLTTKQAQHAQIQERLENHQGTEEDSAEYLYLGGYIDCLKDILNAGATLR